MPAGMDGLETFTALRKINPKLICCFLSGDTGEYRDVSASE
jgi:hypothetical protein